MCVCVCVYRVRLLLPAWLVGALSLFSFQVLAALTPDAQVVVVAMNRNDEAITFRLADEATGRTANLTVDGHTIQTLWYAASE